MVKKPPRFGILGYTTVRAHTRSVPRSHEEVAREKALKRLQKKPRKKRGQVSYAGTGQL